MRIGRLHDRVDPSRVPEEGLASFVLTVVVTLALYGWVQPIFATGYGLPMEAYGEPVLVWALLRQAGVREFLLLLFFALPLLRWKATSWVSLGEAGRTYRWVVTGLCFALGWAFSTYDYNLFADQAHGLDRAIVVVSVVLVFVHPAFVTLLLAAVYLITGQFSLPIGAYTFTDKQPLFSALALWVVFTNLRAIVRIDLRCWLMLSVSILGVYYAQAFYGKLLLPWFPENQLANLFVASHLHGWLAGLSESTVLWVAGVVEQWNPLLLVFALVAEVSPIFFFAHRRIAVFSILAAVFMHVGILAASGIFFWKWIVFDLLLLTFVLGPQRANFASMFSWRGRYFIVSACLSAGLGVAVFQPLQLGWIDTRLNYTYVLEVEDPDGGWRTVGADMMSPFDVVFAQNRFNYLVDAPNVELTFGGTKDPAVFSALGAAQSTEEVRHIEQTQGNQTRRLRRIEALAHFIQQTFRTMNQYGGKPGLPRWIAAPHHIQVRGGPDAYDGSFPVRRARVRWESSWYADGRIDRFRDRIVLMMTIPGSSDAVGEGRALPGTNDRSR